MKKVTYLAHVVLAVVDVDGAVLALKTRKTLASIISIVINARSVIFTRIILFSTKGNFPLTKIAHKAGGAFALIRVHQINTGCVILTVIVQAVVYVMFTSKSRIAGLANTTVRENTYVKIVIITIDCFGMIVNSKLRCNQQSIHMNNNLNLQKMHCVAKVRIEQ